MKSIYFIWPIPICIAFELEHSLVTRFTLLFYNFPAMVMRAAFLSPITPAFYMRLEVAYIIYLEYALHSICMLSVMCLQLLVLFLLLFMFLVILSLVFQLLFLVFLIIYLLIFLVFLLIYLLIFFVLFIIPSVIFLLANIL